MLMRSPLARDRRQPPGFIRPCKPVLSLRVPIGPEWIHELKHDGFRIVANKDGDVVRLWSRNGRDWSAEFVAITAAVIALPFARIVLDGEAVAAARKGNALLGPHGCASACLYAFDLLRLGGPLALSERRALLRKHLRKAAPALIYSEHMESQDAEAMFRHACAMGLEGIGCRSTRGAGARLSMVQPAVQLDHTQSDASLQVCDDRRLSLTRLFQQVRQYRHRLRALVHRHLQPQLLEFTELAEAIELSGKRLPNGS
jgi:hypothetical protein